MNWARVCVLTVALLAPGSAFGEDTAYGPLDGMRFQGKLGPVENPDRDDTLFFEDGRFWSAVCVVCGFTPGEYWVRRVDDGIRFQGELKSPDRGTFAYSGVVKGKDIDVSIRWTRHRWYWSIDRDFSFQGTLAEEPIAV